MYTNGTPYSARLVRQRPGYNDDIKLMKLTTPVKFTDSIYPARLPDMDDCKPGTRITAAGHGQMVGRDRNDLPKDLQYGSGTIISKRQKGYIFTTHVTCQGDSGGPYVKGFGKDAVLLAVNAFGARAACGLSLIHI